LLLKAREYRGVKKTIRGKKFPTRRVNQVLEAEKNRFSCPELGTTKGD
jgi:hypothetical protein